MQQDKFTTILMAFRCSEEIRRTLPADKPRQALAHAVKDYACLQCVDVAPEGRHLLLALLDLCPWDTIADLLILDRSLAEGSRTPTSLALVGGAGSAALKGGR
ncbi:MAG TPA: hypothetical protein VKT77_12520 [Chthonomonadaceae bacterium]|nr:hypothetical protein [Chthonomonadaceae bacterium]